MAHNSRDFIEKLTDIFVRQNVITAEEGKVMQKTFEDSDSDSYVEFLLDEGLIDRTRMLTALGAYYQVPSFDCDGYFFEYHELHKFPKDFLLRYEIIPLELDENIFVVVAAEPDNDELLPAIGNHVSYDIRFLVGIRQDIIDAIEDFYDRAITEVQADEDRREEHRLEMEEQGAELADEEFVRYEEGEDED